MCDTRQRLTSWLITFVNGQTVKIFVPISYLHPNTWWKIIIFKNVSFLLRPRHSLQWQWPDWCYTTLYETVDYDLCQTVQYNISTDGAFTSSYAVTSDSVCIVSHCWSGWFVENLLLYFWSCQSFCLWFPKLRSDQITWDHTVITVSISSKKKSWCDRRAMKLQSCKTAC